MHDAVTCMKKYENLILSKKQNVINLTYSQGYLLHKFKESKKLIDIVKELGISKSTISFKVSLYKLLKKFPF